MIKFLRKIKIDKKEWLGLLLIVMLGTFLRFYNLEWKMRFIWDEARDMRAIRNIWVEKDLTLFGPYNELDGKKDFYGVFHYYLMLPWLVLANFDPVGPAIFTAGLGVVSIGLVYWYTYLKKREVALSVAWLYGLSPLVVEYVRWPWNPNTSGFFGVVYLLITEAVVNKKKWWLGLIAGVILGLVFQLHYVAASVGLVGTGVIWFGIKKSKAKILVAKLIGFVLPNLSFLVFDLSHDFFYLKVFGESFFGSESDSLLRGMIGEKITEPIRVLSQLLSGLFGADGWWGYVLAIVWILMSGFRVKLWLKQRKVGLADLVVVSINLVVLSGLVLGKLIKPYQLASLYGVVLLSLCWIGFDYLNSRGLKKLFFTLVFGVGVWMGMNTSVFKEPIWMEKLPVTKQVSEIIVNDAKNEPKKFNVASVADADNRAGKYRYFVEVDGLETLKEEEYGEAEVLYVVSLKNEFNLEEHPEWELSSFGGAEVKSLGSVDGFWVYKLTKAGLE